MRVSASAKTISERMPGMVQRGLRLNRSHAQNEKHPAISPAAASEYQRNDLIPIPLAMRRFAHIRSSRGSDIARHDPPAAALLLGARSGHPTPVAFVGTVPASAVAALQRLQTHVADDAFHPIGSHRFALNATQRDFGRHQSDNVVCRQPARVSAAPDLFPIADCRCWRPAFRR